MPDQKIVLSKLEQIQSEMLRIGMWQEQPLEPEQYDFRAAFALDTMTFSQWLQFIFIPNVRGLAASGKFPASSQVGTKAQREFDGVDEASGLITLLVEFDALF